MRACLGTDNVRTKECVVPDLLLVLVTVALFAVLVLVVRGVERL